MSAPPVFIEVLLVDGPVVWTPLEPFPVRAGGECVFFGRTRLETHDEHGALVRLSYDCYRPMAEKVLRDLADQAVRDYGCHAVRVRHAVGDVPPGEASVLVQVACGHRAEAFAACRFLIDRLKTDAPIWKREDWSDGHTWTEGHAVEPGGAS